MSSAMEQIKRESFRDGVRYALEYLADLYEGLEETDLWTDYMKEGDSNE